MVNNAFLERASCPFCEHKKSKLIFKKSLDSNEAKIFFSKHLNKNFPFKILKKKKFLVLECENCSGIYQKNVLNKKYTNFFYENFVPQEKSYLKKKNNEKSLDKIYSSEIKYLKKFFEKKRINTLEIGAGWGYWAKCAKKNMLNVSVVEISKIRRKYLKQNKIKTFMHLDEIKEKFDLIYSDQTFEHLTYPLKYLRKINKLLNPGGIVYLKVPPGIYIKKKLNKYYNFREDEIIPLEHINVFNRKVNRIIAEKVGLNYIFPKNIYYIFSFDFFKRNIINFYEFYTSKTIIFRK